VTFLMLAKRNMGMYLQLGYEHLIARHLYFVIQNSRTIRHFLNYAVEKGYLNKEPKRLIHSHYVTYGESSLAARHGSTILTAGRLTRYPLLLYVVSSSTKERRFVRKASGPHCSHLMS
jgi:hypothetical protein